LSKTKSNPFLLGISKIHTDIFKNPEISYWNPAWVDMEIMIPV
jgi:hypothetical protein